MTEREDAAREAAKIATDVLADLNANDVHWEYVRKEILRRMNVEDVETKE